MLKLLTIPFLVPCYASPGPMADEKVIIKICFRSNYAVNYGRMFKK